jgi:hypothetical protein
MSGTYGYCLMCRDGVKPATDLSPLGLCKRCAAGVERRAWIPLGTPPPGVTVGPVETSKASNPKEAFGSNKLPLHLWPTTATAMGCLAFLHGALKYGKHNWRDAGVRATTYLDALYRHMAAWYEGEDLDPDSGLSHLAHALACIAVIVDAQAAGKLNDDRAFPGGYGKLTAELTKLVAKLKEAAKGRPEPKHYTKGMDHTGDADPYTRGMPTYRVDVKFGVQPVSAEAPPVTCALTLRPHCDAESRRLCGFPGCPTAPGEAPKP